MNFAGFINRQVTRALRNLPRPGSRHIYGFPQIPVAGRGPCLLIMSRPAEFDMAVWCAWSWMAHLAIPVRLKLVVDGTPSPGKVIAAQKLLPGAEIFDVCSALNFSPLARRG